ncbi:MAG: hypothetical protein WC343_06020 [Bacilli bacterium]|jgi:hypothetical protein
MNKQDFGQCVNNLWELYGNAVLKRDGVLSDLGYISALLWANYGEDGKTFPGIIKEEDSIRVMLEKVLKFYHRQLKNDEAQSEGG